MSDIRAWFGGLLMELGYWLECKGERVLDKACGYKRKERWSKADVAALDAHNQNDNDCSTYDLG